MQTSPTEYIWCALDARSLPVRMNAPKCTGDPAKVTVADDFALLNELVLKPGETKSITISGTKP